MKKTLGPYVRAQGAKVVGPDGRPLFLRGVNFGGWLMMEGYFMNALNLPVKAFKKSFAATLGKAALKDFEHKFHSAFIQEEDFKRVAQAGFNSIRLPFHGGLVETKPHHYDPRGVAYLDRALAWAAKHNVYVLLDLHAAPGSQNHDWHSDSDGRAELWTKPANQKRTLALWEFLADRYKDHPAVAGYDLLNEAVLGDTALLNKFYKQVIKVIRSADKNHTIFVEGNRWSQDLECLEDFDDDNLVYSIHFYEPLEYTFNFISLLKYPLVNGTARWDKAQMRRRLESYVTLARAKGRAIHVGEFGVNYRGGLFAEDVYLRDLVSVFEELGFHWNYWTYKSVKNHMFPDGIFSYYPNAPWVNRPGPKMGWETWAALWPQKKREMVDSWRTESFTLNEPVLNALKKGI